MSSSVILKTFGRKTAQVISNQLFIDCLLMIHFYYFEQGIIINKQHKNIKFTSEIEENGSLSFLYIKISRGNNKFVTSVYHKPTFSGVFTNFESFLPDIYKRGLIETLLNRSFRLRSNYENFHREIEPLKSILKHNSYPHNLVNHCIKNCSISCLSKGTLISWFLKGS